jgi:hypothetical protein
MKKQNLLTLTLIISGLSLSPVMAEAVLTTVSHSQNINHSVSSSISSLLYNRGLDEDAADEISENFVSEEDEALLAMLMNDLETQDIVTRKEVLEYLSMAALHKQKIDFHSYDHLLGMVSKIKQEPLNENTRKVLSSIVKLNKQLFV